MADSRVLELTREIRDLYMRQCTLADQYNGVQIAEAADLKEKCRARAHPAMPEVERFASAFDAMDALKKAYAEPAIKRRRERGMAVMWLVMVYLCWKLMEYSGSMLLPFVACVVLGGVMIYVGQRVVMNREGIQRSLRLQLRDRGVPICMGCGYDLRGQTVARCPECGDAFDLALAALPSER